MELKDTLNTEIMREIVILIFNYQQKNLKNWLRNHAITVVAIHQIGTPKAVEMELIVKIVMLGMCMKIVSHVAVSVIL